MTDSENQKKADAIDELHYGHHAMAFSISYLLMLSIVGSYIKFNSGPVSIYYNSLLKTYSVFPFILLLCILSITFIHKLTEKHPITTILAMCCIGTICPILATISQQGISLLTQITLPRMWQEGMIIGAGLAGLLLGLIYVSILQIMKRKIHRQ